MVKGSARLPRRLVEGEGQVENFGEREAGPSWARDNWPLIELDEVNAGLDPTRMAIEKLSVRARGAAAATGASAAEIERAANDSICAMMLIRTYRVRGHLAADLDPLGLVERRMPADLTPEFHGFVGEGALDRPVWLGGALGLEKASGSRAQAGRARAGRSQSWTTSMRGSIPPE